MPALYLSKFCIEDKSIKSILHNSAAYRLAASFSSSFQNSPTNKIFAFGAFTLRYFISSTKSSLSVVLSKTFSPN